MEQKLIEAKFRKNRFAQVLLIVGAILVVLGIAMSGIVYTTGEYRGYGYWYYCDYSDRFNYGEFLIALFSNCIIF